MKIPFSSGAVVSKMFWPPEAERAETSFGGSAEKLSMDGAELRFRYASSTRRTRAVAFGSPDMRTFHWR